MSKSKRLYKIIESFCSIEYKMSQFTVIVSKLWHSFARGFLLTYYNYYVKPVIQYGILICDSTLSRFNDFSFAQRKWLRLIFLRVLEIVFNKNSRKIRYHQLCGFVSDRFKFALRRVR